MGPVMESVRRGWALLVREGPGKNDQYAQEGSRRYLTQEALQWRGEVAAQLAGEPTLTGLVSLYVLHLSSGQGRDDFDHQSTAAADAVSWTRRSARAKTLPAWASTPQGRAVLMACRIAGGWLDDKQVAKVDIRRIVVPLEQSGLYVWAEEIAQEEELWS